MFRVKYRIRVVPLVILNKKERKRDEKGTTKTVHVDVVNGFISYLSVRKPRLHDYNFYYNFLHYFLCDAHTVALPSNPLDTLCVLFVFI